MSVHKVSKALSVRRVIKVMLVPMVLESLLLEVILMLILLPRQVLPEICGSLLSMLCLMLKQAMAL